MIRASLLVLLGSQLESSLEKPFTLRAGTCGVVSHHSHIVIFIREQSDNQGLALGASAQDILGLLHLQSGVVLVVLLHPVLDTMSDQFTANLLSNVWYRLPRDPDSCRVEWAGTNFSGSHLRQILSRHHLHLLGDGSWTAVSVDTLVVEDLDL